MSTLSETLQAIAGAGKIYGSAKNVGEMPGLRSARERLHLGNFLRKSGAIGGELRRAKSELDDALKPVQNMQDAKAAQIELDKRHERVMDSMLKMQKAYTKSAKEAANAETATAFRQKAKAVDQLRAQYESLEKEERRYLEAAKRVNELKRKGHLSAGEAAELRKANAEMDELAPQFKDISDNLEDINDGAEELSKNMGDDGVAGGARDSAKHMSDFSDNTDDSIKKTGKLSSLWQTLKANLGNITFGVLAGQVFAEFNELTNKTIETYYSYGESLSRVDHGVLRLSRDTWNLAHLQSKLGYAAIEANMPMEAALGVYDQLSQKLRIIYGPHGAIRTDVAYKATKSILGFSRVTGASVEQSTELYTRFINHFGKSVTEAGDSMNAIARGGQLVNEQLEDMGVKGGVFISDLTGIINDAAQAFDGFTLNVDHLSARVQFAVKTGHELGMTYDQAMDSAKQMTSIFAKPGGYLGFQAGSQLRDEVADAVKGVDDAEERAEILSRKYKISTSTARTLDIAKSDVNAQMQVMEILKGTDAGMEKQYELMRGVADNNSQSLEVFKQFVGGENLNPEQAGDLLQVLRKGGSFGDFKSHVDRTKKDASLDEVIKNSVIGPKMIKDFILSTNTFTKALVVQGWGIMKLAALGGAIFASVAGIAFAVKAVLAIPKALRMAGEWIGERFGDKLVWLKQLGSKAGQIFGKGLKNIGPFFDSAKQVVKQLWKYLRTGSLFDHIGTFLKVAKGYLGMIPHELHNIWALFRSGAARVSAVIVRGGKGAARAYQHFSKYNDPYAKENVSGTGAGNSMFGSIADVLGIDAPNGEFGAFGNLGYDRHNPEVREARKKRIAHLKQLRDEERTFKEANPGKSAGWFKAKRFAKRAGGIAGPVAGNVESSAVLGSGGGKFAAAVGIGMTLLSATGIADSLMTDKLDTEDDEKKTAGYRKHGEEIEKKQKEIDDVSETLEYVRETHDTALIAAIEAEKKDKEAEKDLLDKDKDRLNKLEEDYEHKRKTIETLKDYAKRLKKKGKDKEADALDKRIEELKRSAGEDKGKLNAAGVSTKSENEFWQKVNDMSIKIMLGFDVFYVMLKNWKSFANIALKIGGFGGHLIGLIKPLGTMIEGAKTAISVIKASGMFGWLFKIAGVIGRFAKVLAKFSGIMDGIIAFGSTEGGVGRRLFAGVTAGATSIGVHTLAHLGAAATGVETGGVGAAAFELAGSVGGSYAANKVKDVALHNVYDKIFGPDSNIPTITPEASPSPTPTIAGSGVVNGSMSNVDSNGAVTLRIHNFQDVLQSGNSRIASDNSGMSGR